MSDQSGQASLLPGLVRARKPIVPAASAAEQPIARVLVDIPLAHLDRPFDYSVPEAMAEKAQPGVRVKVRFAGKDVDGYVVERADTTEHTGSLTPLRRVVSPEPVLTPEVAALTGAVATRYAGTRSDVLRLAIPPRHATTEKETSTPAAHFTATTSADAWAGHTHGESFVAQLGGARPLRAVLAAAPGADWPRMLAQAAAAALAGGRGALLVVPDGRDVDRVDAALTSVLGEGQHVALRADSGPSRRYRDFLALSRGARRVVVGTRAAAFAPVRDLGLVAIWDDGDDLHAEPRAPYPHAREVLLLRAEAESTSALVGGFARTVEADYLLRTGWAHEITPSRTELRARVTVSITGATDQAVERDPARGSRLPAEALAVIRAALTRGPVLVQTPRSGYAASLACERCRTPARCLICSGPLALSGPTSPPACRWCATAAPGWACVECGHRGLRAPTIGDARTAEELGRTFPGVRVRTSSAGSVLDRVPEQAALIVATPGAEPIADRGYAAVILLDTWLALARADLRVEEEALRRWLNAAGLVAVGGHVVAVGDPAQPALQALVRWDPGGFAAREHGLRVEAHLPPASRMATLTGDEAALADALSLLAAPPATETLGPVPVGDELRLVLRVPRAQGPALTEALIELQRLRSSRKLAAVRVQVDPPSLG
jgi:primosomal protein N' (replication factor Y)